MSVQIFIEICPTVVKAFPKSQKQCGLTNILTSFSFNGRNHFYFLMSEASDLFHTLLVFFWMHWKQTLHKHPWTVSQCISSDWMMIDSFYFWLDCLGSVLPSFLPCRLQLRLSLVSWANSQRQGWWWAWTTSNKHQTLQPEDKQEPWSSAQLCHCLLSKNGPRMSMCHIDEDCQTGGEQCKPTIHFLFVSIFFCSALCDLDV